MRKIFSLFAALTLSVGLWAIDNVAYIDAAGQPQTANGVNEITSTSATLEAGWYVVNGTDVQTSGLVCNGAVNLILADGAKLTATGDYNAQASGIQVSGDDNSLTIYGQTAQSGQLIANGGLFAAGIGGRQGESGSNITINGGIVTANGGAQGAGIGGGDNGVGSNITINGGTVTATGGDGGAGIGGAVMMNGFNITINGGTVTATGGSFYNNLYADGIGGGADGGSGSNIFVATKCIVKADNNNPPTTVIAATRTATTDIASDLAGKRYATVETVPTIVVNVTVPAGTPACYFYGEMSGNLFVEMTKVDETHYTTEFPGATTIGWGYLFVWESGNWNTKNADPEGDIKIEPEDGVINIEIKAWITAPAPPAPVVGENFEDATSGLWFKVTAVGDNYTAKVISNGYKGNSYIIPDTVKYKEVDFAVTEIGAEAFYGCSSLQSITIHEGVTKIGECAFIRSGLQSVTLPASLTTIETRSFFNCSSLTSVTFLGNSCTIGEQVFYGVGTADNPVTLVLPADWTGSKPAEDGKWYDGYFKIDATALPTINAKAKANKFMHNGQFILRSSEKTYTILGQGL